MKKFEEADRPNLDIAPMSESPTTDETLRMPSFEEELKKSDFMESEECPSKEARIVTCTICGMQTLVDLNSRFTCPNSPHDGEDGVFTVEDIHNNIPDDISETDEEEEDK